MERFVAAGVQGFRRTNDKTPVHPRYIDGMKRNTARFVRSLETTQKFRRSWIAQVMNKNTQGAPWAHTYLATVFQFLRNMKCTMQSGERFSVTMFSPGFVFCLFVLALAR